MKRIRLTDIDDRLYGLGLWLNQEGTIICTRHLVTDPGPQVLVQFDGYRGHVALNQDMIEAL